MCAQLRDSQAASPSGDPPARLWVTSWGQSLSWRCVPSQAPPGVILTCGHQGKVFPAKMQPPGGRGDQAPTHRGLLPALHNPLPLYPLQDPQCQATTRVSSGGAPAPGSGERKLISPTPLAVPGSLGQWLEKPTSQRPVGNVKRPSGRVGTGASWVKQAPSKCVQQGCGPSGHVCLSLLTEAWRTEFL